MPWVPLLSTQPAPLAWLSALPDELVNQRRLLEQLISWCENESSVCWLIVGCSLQRGNADRFSDLDVAVGASENDISSTTARLVEKLPELGDLIGYYEEEYGPPQGQRRVFAQFADRTQIDAVLTDATRSHFADVIALYDPAGVVVSIESRAGVDPEKVALFSNQGWEQLANVGKYLRRGALWEARRSLEEARSHLFQLLAVQADAPRPEFGLTELFDLEPVPELPPGLEDTTARLDGSELLHAALETSRLFSQVEENLCSRGRLRQTSALAMFVQVDLTECRNPPN